MLNICRPLLRDFNGYTFFINIHVLTIHFPYIICILFVKLVMIFIFLSSSRFYVTRYKSILLLLKNPSRTLRSKSKKVC